MTRTQNSGSDSPARKLPVWLRLLAAGLLAVAGLMVGLVLVLQTSWGVHTAANLALRLANPWPGTELDAADARGSLFGGFSLLDVELRPHAGSPSLHADTLRLDYRWTELLGRPLRVRGIHLSGVRLTATWRDSSGFDLLSPFLNGGPPKPKKGPGFAMVMDDLSLTRASIDARFPARARDTLIALPEVAARMRDLRVNAPATTFELDTLGASVQLVDPPAIGFALRARAALAADQFRFTTLRLDGPRTRVAAEGALPVGRSGPPSNDGIAFHARLTPMAGDEFQRVLGFAWNPGDLQASLDLQGSGPALALDADASMGEGRLTAHAKGVPSRSGPVQLTARAEARTLDLGPLIGRAPGELKITGQLSADVHGADLAHLDGPVSLSLDDSRLSGFDVTEARLDAPFTGGEAALQLRADVDPYAVTASGPVRPFANPPTYDLSARIAFPPLPVDSTARRPWAAGAIHAALKGQGFALDQMVAKLSAASEPDARFDPLIGAGTLDLSLAKRIADWTAAFDVAGGTLQAGGKVTLDETPRYEVRGGVLRGIDVAALAGDTTSSRLDARFSLDGRGFDPKLARGSARLDSVTLAWGAHRIEHASASVELRDAAARLRGQALADGANVDFDGSLGPLAPRIRRADLDLTFRGLDLARVLADTSYASALAGRVRAHAEGPDLLAAVRAAGGHGPLAPGTRADANLSLEPSRWRSERISTLDLSGRLENQDVALSGNLESTFGRAALRGGARPFDSPPSARIERLDFGALDLGQMLALNGQHTDLQGTLTGRAAGRDSSDLEGNFQLALDGSAINGVRFEQLGASGVLKRGDLDASVRARSRGDSIAISASGRPLENPGVVRAHGTLDFEHLAELLALKIPKASAHLRFEASLDRRGSTRPAAMQADGWLKGRAQVGEARVDSMSTQFELRDGVLRLPRFDLAGNFATLTGSGQWVSPLASPGDSTRLSLSGVTRDLSTLAPLVGAQVLSIGTGSFSLEAAGPPEATRFSGEVAATRPHYDGYWADTLGIRFTGMLRDTSLAALEAKVRARSLVVSPFAPRDVVTDARWDGTTLSATTQASAGPDRTQDVAFQLVPKESRLRLERAELRYDKAHFTLQQPGEIRYGKDLHVDSLVVLENGRRCLSLEGDLASSGASHVQAQVDSLDLRPVLEPFGVSNLSGTISALATLAGTRERPEVDATLRGAIATSGRRPAHLEGRARWRDDSLNAGLDFLQSANQGLSFNGRLPLRLNLAANPAVSGGQQAMDAHLEAKRFDLSWFEPLFSKREVRGLRGELDGRVDAKGDPARPGLSGSLALTRANIELPQLGTTFEKGEAKLGFSDRVVRLERATIHSGKGQLDASGRVELLGPARRTVDLQAQWKRFTAMNTLLAKVETTGKLTATGRLQAPRVEGDVTLQNTTLYAEAGEQKKSGERVELSEADRRELQERFGYGVSSKEDQGTPFDSIDANVQVKIGDNVWVRRRSDPIVALEMEGQVRATKAPAADPRVAGQLGIQTGRSYLSFLGRQFQMTRARVDLPGPVDSAHAELEARYDGSSSSSGSSSATVTAYVTLDAEGARADFQSEPYMDRASLLNYLATGQTQGELASGSAYGLAVGSMLGAVGGAAGRSLGFQVVQVTQDAYGGQTLSAGNYVDPRVYLGFRQPVVEGQRSNQTSQGGTYSTEFEVELEVLKQLLLNLQGGGSQYRFLLRPRLGN